MNKDWFDMVKYDGLGDTETFEATYDIAISLIRRHVPGDFVECGVYKGAHCAIMARAILDHPAGFDMPRQIHLFDSFEGIPAPGPRDLERVAAGYKAGEASFSAEGVIDKMTAWGIPEELLVYHHGYFAQTVPAAMHAGLGEIAFLRIDCDDYQSMQDCAPLLTKLSRGAWVCADDFNLAGFREALLEMVVPAPIYWRVPTK